MTKCLQFVSVLIFAQILIPVRAQTTSKPELKVSVGHSGSASTAVFSRDGKFIVSGGIHDKVAILWEARTGNEIRRFVGHKQPINSVAFSPDSRYVLTGGGQNRKNFDDDNSTDNSARLWEVASGNEVRQFTGHQGSVNAVAFSPDGRSVLTGSSDKTARLWNLATGDEIRRFIGHNDPVNSVAFSPRSNLVATGSGAINDSTDCTARLWDLNSGMEMRRFTGHSIAVGQVAFSPDGISLFTGIVPMSSQFWIDQYLKQENFEGPAQSIIQWNVTSGLMVNKFDGHGAFAISPDGQLLLTAGAGESMEGAQIWQLSTGQKLGFVEGDGNASELETGEVTSISFSPNAASAVLVFDVVSSGGSNGAIYGKVALRVIEVSIPEITVELGGNYVPVLRTKFSADNNSILSGEFLWSTNTGGIVPFAAYRSDPGNNRFYDDKAYAYSPDGTLFAKSDSSEPDAQVGIWDTRSGNKLLSIGSCQSVSFTRKNGFALCEDRSFSGDGVALWDLAKATKSWTFHPIIRLSNAEAGWFGGRMSFARFVAGDSLVAVVDGNVDIDEGKIKLFDLPTGKLKNQIEYSGNQFISTSPDGRFLVLTDMHAKTARVIDLMNTDRTQSFGLSRELGVSWLVSESSVDHSLWVFGLYYEHPTPGVQKERLFLKSLLSPETESLAHEVYETQYVKHATVPPAVMSKLTRMLVDDANKFIRTNRAVDLTLLEKMGLSERLRKAIAAQPTEENLLIYNRALLDSQLSVFRSSYEIRISGFSPDERLVATVTIGDSVNTATEIWDIASSKRVAILPGVGPLLGPYSALEEGVKELEFSPDNTRLLANDGLVVKVWDLATGTLLSQVRAEQNLIYSASFSPSGAFIITGSSDGAARISHVKTGKELCRMIAFRNGDWLVASPDGRFDTNNLESFRGANFVFPDDPSIPISPVTFARQYYEPRLLARLLNGEELPTIQDPSRLNRVQPGVTIAKIVNSPTNPGSLDVTVTVESKSNIEGAERAVRSNNIPRRSGAFDLRLFRDGQLVGVSTPTAKLAEFINYAPRILKQSRTPRRPTNTSEDMAWREANDLFQLKSANLKAISPNQVQYIFRNIKLPRDGRKEVEFTAYAFNSDRVKSETTEPFKFKIPALVANPPRKGRAYLISIGVNASENLQYNLRYAANDARKMQEIIGGRLKADAAKYSDVVQVPLISDYGADKNPTETTARKAIIKGVFSLLAGHPEEVPAEVLAKIPNRDKLTAVEPEDTLIITYSGHGYTDRSGIFYMVPYDNGIPAGGIRTEGLSMLISSDELSLWMQDITANEMIMIIDACHSNAAIQGNGFKPGPMGSRGLGQLAYDKDMKILSATQADNTALEAESLEQGLLTYALLQDGILNSLSDADKNKQLLSTEWLQYAERRVPELYQEVSSGKRKLIVNGKAAKSEDAARLLTQVGANRQSSLNLQQPSLFDFKRRKIAPILFNLP